MKEEDVVKRIQANPKYQELRSKRNRLGWTLAILMLIVYYGYVGLIAFDKEFLAQPIGTGVTTLGVPIALVVILFTIAITVFYVYRANTEYDAMTRDILKEAGQ